MNQITDLKKWMEQIDFYENAHENPKITLTREEILQMLIDKITEVRDKDKNSHRTPFEQKMLFIKFCVLRQTLDDLLCIPNEKRPWTSNEEKWLQEMVARENQTTKPNE